MNKKSGFLKFIHKFVFWFVKITAAPAMLVFRPKVLYPDGKKYKIRGGALLISNHITSFDPLYMQFVIWHRNHHFICAKEFYDKPARAFLFDCFQCIPVDRDNTGIGTMREIASHLKAGELVCMFPEGHVNLAEGGDPELQEFKSGMVLIALMGGAPIIPMVMKRRKTILSRLEAAVGEPVDVASFYGKRPTVAEIEEITNILREKTRKLREALEA